MVKSLSNEIRYCQPISTMIPLQSNLKEIFTMRKLSTLRLGISLDAKTMDLLIRLRSFQEIDLKRPLSYAELVRAAIKEMALRYNIQ
jgi:hypothetical protein